MTTYTKPGDEPSAPKDAKEPKEPKRYTSAAERDAKIAELSAELDVLQSTPLYVEYPKIVNGVVYASAADEHAPAKAAAVPHEDEPPSKRGK